MSTIINATTTNGVVIQPDNSGSLELQTNSGTTALTIDTSQRAAFVAGTAAAPAITTTGDTNTGIFFPAADTIAFSEGGAESMRIDSSGQLLVGTTSGFDSNATGAITLNANAADGVVNFKKGIVFTSDGGSVQPVWAHAGITSTGSAGFNGILVFGTDGTGTQSGTITERMRIDSSGGLILVGSTAQKATGTTWSNPSDQRLKDNIRDYTKGTTELMQVRVREWEYNGKGGTIEGMKGLGVVADEVMTVLPNTVETYDAKLNADDEENTEIKKFDATEITWLLVKTVQEQQTIINDLKERIETLEAK